MSTKKFNHTQLTPDQAALRCFSALRLDDEDCAYIVRFMSIIQPLEGCDYEGDERHHYAETMLRKWIGLCLQYHNETDVPKVSDTLEAAAYDTATLTYWLSGIQPIAGESYCTGDERTCGYNIVLHVIERRLLEACGMLHQRPHRSTGEKFDAAVNEHSDMPLEKLLELAHRIPAKAARLTQ